MKHLNNNCNLLCLVLGKFEGKCKEKKIKGRKRKRKTKSIWSNKLFLFVSSNSLTYFNLLI